MRKLLPIVFYLLLVAAYEPVSNQGIVYILILNAGLTGYGLYTLKEIPREVNRSREALSERLSLPELKMRPWWLLAVVFFSISTPISIADSLISNTPASILLLLLWLYSMHSLQSAIGYLPPNPARQGPFINLFAMTIFYIVMVAASTVISNRFIQFLIGYIVLGIINSLVINRYLRVAHTAYDSGNYEAALQYYETHVRHPARLAVREADVRYHQALLNYKLRNFEIAREAAMDILNLRLSGSHSPIVIRDTVALYTNIEKAQGFGTVHIRNVIT